MSEGEMQRWGTQGDKIKDGRPKDQARGGGAVDTCGNVLSTPGSANSLQICSKSRNGLNYLALSQPEQTTLLRPKPAWHETGKQRQRLLNVPWREKDEDVM